MIASWIDPDVALPLRDERVLVTVMTRQGGRYLTFARLNGQNYLVPENAANKDEVIGWTRLPEVAPYYDPVLGKQT